MEDLEQKSMDDLSFGRQMPRGYVTKEKIDKTVWTKKFFALVHSELNNPIGLDKLMWKWSGYKAGTIIMCSRRMRQVSRCPLAAYSLPPPRPACALASPPCAQPRHRHRRRSWMISTMRRSTRG